MSITAAQRFSKSQPCPICNGFDDATRGVGERCYGFLSDDGRWAHCTREDKAGGLTQNAGSSTFAHRLIGHCKCGIRHDPRLPSSQARGQKKRVVAAYDYQDESGELLYQVLRYEPKGFVQRRPDGTGHWIWGLNDGWYLQDHSGDWRSVKKEPKDQADKKDIKHFDVCTRVPYRLPEIIALDPLSRVYVVEGEQDADRARNNSLIATTNAGGALKWEQRFGENLKGMDVVILPDNDDKGRLHATAVAKSLIGNAASIKVLALPGLPDKGDLSDWLDIGHTCDELKQLADLVPKWDPPSSSNITQAPPSPPGLQNAPPQGNNQHIYALTDVGNAERLAAQHGMDFRYAEEAGDHIWNGRHWERDTTGEVTRRAIAVARSIPKEAIGLADRKTAEDILRHALRSEGNNRIEAMIKLARSLSDIAIRYSAFDNNPWLLCCQNGVLNLQTGFLGPHRREDLITKCVSASYDPDATAPNWISFLETVTGNNPRLIGLLRRAIGYSLTGSTRERAIFILHGSGGNGKTTCLRTIQKMLGDGYGQRTPVETFMLRRDGTIPSDIARLRGARFAYASESEDGKRLSEATLKDLAGDEPITARFMHKDWFQFRPEAKLWLGTNHRPTIRGTDDAIWDRIKLVPFTIRIPEDQRDKQLEQKLEAELPGILAWAVKGCLEWQRDGLGIPDEVKAATTGYREESDLLGRFIADCCLAKPNTQATATDLWKAFQAWCKDNGEYEGTTTAFGRRLGERGLTRIRTRRGAVWQGIGLSVEPDQSVTGLDPVTGCDGISEKQPHVRACASFQENPSQPVTRHTPEQDRDTDNLTSVSAPSANGNASKSSLGSIGVGKIDPSRVQEALDRGFSMAQAREFARVDEFASTTRVQGDSTVDRESGAL